MSVGVAKGSLLDGFKQLRMRWDRIKSTWDDDARRRFEKDCIDPLEPAIHSAFKGFDHVNELMSAVQRECIDEDPVY